MFCLGFGIIGIPFMLSVLADVGGLMAEGIEYAWMVNKDRIRCVAEKLRLRKPRFTLQLIIEIIDIDIVDTII